METTLQERRTRKFESHCLNINSELKIERLERKEAESRPELNDLLNTGIDRGILYLDQHGSQHYFFGRLENVPGLVGFCSLRRYPENPLYGISYLTHTKFEGQGIATTLAKAAVDFAFSNPEIPGIFAHVMTNSQSERIVNKLGFKGHCQNRTGDHRTYHLDTTDRPLIVEDLKPEEIPENFVEIVNRLKINDGVTHKGFKQINWCSSVCAGSMYFDDTSGMRRSRVGEVLEKHFDGNFIYPNYPDDKGALNHRLFDVGATVRSVKPELLGYMHVLAREGQKVFYSEEEGHTQVAVIGTRYRKKHFMVNLFDCKHYLH